MVVTSYDLIIDPTLDAWIVIITSSKFTVQIANCKDHQLQLTKRNFGQVDYGYY